MKRRGRGASSAMAQDGCAAVLPSPACCSGVCRTKVPVTSGSAQPYNNAHCKRQTLLVWHLHHPCIMGQPRKLQPHSLRCKLLREEISPPSSTEVSAEL